MSDLLKLHNQNRNDIMIELDGSNNPRARILHDLVANGNVHSLDENKLGPLRKAGTVFHHSEWASPMLNDRLPFATMLNTNQIKRLLLNDLGGKNLYHFTPTRGSPEKDAQAMVELLNNIGNAHYSKPGSILHMDCPTFESLCEYKANWPYDGMLGHSPVDIAVMPADDIQDMDYHDNYFLSTLLTGTKIWFVYPPHQENIASLNLEYQAILINEGVFAMDHAANFQHGIGIVQRAGQTVIVPPFWITVSISTQTSVSCSYCMSTALVFADRIKFLKVFLLNTNLWLAGNGPGQERLVSFTTEFMQQLQEILADSFPLFKASTVIIKICQEYEELRTNLRFTLDAIEDKAVVRGLESVYRAMWLKFLEKKRKKSPACRLCKLRIESMPPASPEDEDRDRLRKHFVDFHCLRSAHSMSHGKGV